MASVAIGYQEAGISHPSLWLGAYEADHPALALHYKNSCGPSAANQPEKSLGKEQKEESGDTTTDPEDISNSDSKDPAEDESNSDNKESSTCAEPQKPQSTTTIGSDTTATTTSTTPEAPKQPEGIEVQVPHPWYALFPTDVAADLVERTKERVQDLLEASSILNNKPLERKVPRLELDKDIERGDLLGTGGFAMIYNARIKDPSCFHNRRNSKKENREYVIKHLSPDLIKEPRRLHIGTRDFVLESHLMATLDHPHILKTVGCSKGGISNFGVTLRTDAFFIVLPKLTCTLTERMKSWRAEDEARRLRPKVLGYPEPTKSFSWSTGAILARQRILRETEEHERKLDFFYYRLQVVVDLLSALQYLHEKRLFHRDIKPDNIGFDTQGCLKLFDFGLAKELPPDEEAANKGCTNTKADLTFAFPGNTGTARYMAPEVIRRQPYNCKVDVYAASILCWEVLMMERAYISDGVPSGQFFKDCIAIYGDRPPVPKRWPRALRKIVKLGWIKDISTRPTSAKMKHALQKIVDERRNSR